MQDTKKYVELDSTFRNRNLYPLPSQFKVKILNTQKDNSKDALDGVSDGESNYIWRGALDASITLYGVPSAPILFFNSPGDFSAFRGQFVVDSTIGSGEQSSLITFYSEYSQTAFLETPFGDEWEAGDVGELLNQSDNQHILFTLRMNTMDDQFKGHYLYDMTIGEYRLITSYDDKFRILTLDSPFGGSWAKTDDYIIVKEKAKSADNLTNLGDTDFPTSSSVILPATESSIDDIYKGDYIKIVQFINSIGTGQYVTWTRLITGYNGTTKTVTFSPSIPLTEMSATNIVNYQILKFTKDISTSLTGFIDENNIPKLYRISLNNLVLPNTTINNGGSTSFYPYVYVVFSNDINRTHSLINSNNTNSRRATFRCSITDVDNLEYSTFIKLRSEMIDTFMFNPREDLYFEVYLPDGSLFTPQTPENESPLYPNPMIQISCCISFEEVFES